MSCNCLKTIREKFLTEQPVKDKIITDVSFKTLWELTDDGVITKPKIEAFLTVEGRKSDFPVSLTYGFCPFCGKIFSAKESFNDANA